MRGQAPEEDRLKILTDPESVQKKLEKDKTRPPLEIFRSQVAPFDVLPFVKANHWSTLSLEVRSNYNDYTGSRQTAPVLLLGLPQEIVYSRDARLAKAQQSRISMQAMLPKVPKELTLELVQSEGIRPDVFWPAPLRVLEPHQMLLVVLTKETTDAYAPWNRLQALYPHFLDRQDVQAVDRMRYYRLVLPIEPEKPPLSAHPLTWTTISHVVWDGMPPDTLNPGQQEALVDWLHWGGQLTLVGGPGPSFSLLKDSFLTPFLPAEATGRCSHAPTSRRWPPPTRRRRPRRSATRMKRCNRPICPNRPEGFPTVIGLLCRSDLPRTDRYFSPGSGRNPGRSASRWTTRGNGCSASSGASGGGAS